MDSSFLPSSMAFLVPLFDSYLSPILSYGMLLGGMILKVPQIQAVWVAKSGEGLSLSSIFFETIGYTFFSLHSYFKEKQFQEYGENIFCIFQNSLLVLLIWLFGKYSKTKLSIIVVSYATLVLLLIHKLPQDYHEWLGNCTILITLASRLPQILTNFTNQHTGPLAIFTVFLSLGGTAARVLTNLGKWEDDPLSVINFILATGLNGILFLQILLYREKTKE